MLSPVHDRPVATALPQHTPESFAADADADRDFRLLADNLPAFCWIANGDGYIFWYNRRFCEYTGMSLDELAGWGWRPIHDPDLLPAVMAKWTGAIERGERFEMTFPLKAADGSYRTFLTRVEPFRDASGRIVRWFGVNIDVTGETVLRQQLGESEAALQAFFETAGIYVAILDLDADDFTFVLANRRMARFWGADGVTGRSARSLAAGKLPRTMMSTLTSASCSSKPTTFEYPFRAPDGDERWFTATLTPMPAGPSGKPRISIASLDITPRKQAEAALAEALEAKDTLLHEVNHRVKNSLQLVTALLSLQAAQAADAKLRTSLLEARGRVSVVASMHQRLYSTSAHDRVDLVGYLRELAASNVAAHGAEGLIGLDFDADDELILDLTRAVPLALVVGELLTNAFKYAFPGGRRGTVCVSLHRVAGEVRLVVADDGIGLPEGFAIARAGSLGMKIVRSLTRQIAASVTIGGGTGARFEIVVPEAK